MPLAKDDKDKIIKKYKTHEADTGSSEIQIGASRTGEVIRYIADISRAQQTFGYSPKTSFEEGIKKYLGNRQYKNSVVPAPRFYH